MTAAASQAPRRPAAPLDLHKPGRFHVVGVGGPGMSAVAQVLREMGHHVSGSDLRESPALDRLRDIGVDVHLGHDPAYVGGADAVTYSTAIPLHNAEIQAAAAAGTPVMHRAGMLASICAMARSIGVAGTHGKTTTSSLLMTVLAEAGWAPSFVIGGDVAGLGTGAGWTGSEWLVVESDESDKTHLALPLHATILTNVEADHLEHWGTFEAIVAGFEQYLGQISGPKVLCADDTHCRALAGADLPAGVVTYGLAAGADYRITEMSAASGRQRFSVVHGNDVLGPFDLALRGVHNVVNACAVVAMAVELGVPADAVERGLSRFSGVARRFDQRGEHRGATLIDDYAHLPTEIAAVLAAARHSGDGWSRLVAVFQPNRFRRMAVLSPEYRDAFVDADLVIVTEIYPSGDAPIPGVTGKLVVDAVLDAHPHQQIVWLPARHDLVDYLARHLRHGDVCISMGCGDVEYLPDEVLARGRELDSAG